MHESSTPITALCPRGGGCLPKEKALECDHIPTKFILRCRIYRKRRAAKIVTFVNECAEEDTVHNEKVHPERKTVFVSRTQFLEVNQARVIMLKKYRREPNWPYGEDAIMPIKRG